MPCRCLATCCWHGVPRRPDPAIPAIPEPCGDGKIDNSGPFFRMIRAGPMTAQFPSLSMPLMLTPPRSEEHTSELQSLMRISYAVFCLKKKNKKQNIDTLTQQIL